MKALRSIICLSLFKLAIILSPLEKSSWNVFATQGKAESLFWVSWDGNRGYIDDNGKLLFKLPKEVYQAGRFSDGLACIAVTTPDHYGRRGFIDTAGKVVIEPQFIRAEGFSEGLARVEINGKVGYINKQGKLVIEPKFQQDSDTGFSEGLAAVKLFIEEGTGLTRQIKYLTGYINKEGSFVIQPQFIYGGPFKDGMARIKSIRGVEKYGYIDKSGKVVVPSQFPQAFDFSEGLAMVMVYADQENQVKKVGYIDKTGKLLIEPTFDDPLTMTLGPSRLHEAFTYDITGTEGVFSEGLASVRVKGKFGFINRAGQMVIAPQFVHAGMFKEGLAPVSIKTERRRMYGFIDHTGKFIIQPQYDFAREFNNGLAVVSVMNSRGEFDKIGYIDKTGKYVWKPTK